MHTAKFHVGDEVITDFSGPITEHVVVDVDCNRRNESGICLKVKPCVPLSACGWMDASWFKLKNAREKTREPC